MTLECCRVLPSVGVSPIHRLRRETRVDTGAAHSGRGGYAAQLGARVRREARPDEQLIFIEETERARAPYVGCNFVGLLHAGPTLIMEASDEQRAQHLPAILKGEHPWCQGFSEPGAGSDLASLSTRAYRDGDYYVVSGQKIWTSYAQIADYCELLVRTNVEAPKHRGLTFFVIDMTAPGRSLRQVES